MKRNRNGFSLIEIMMVVAIVGLLGALAIPAFQRPRERAQNGRLANDFRILGDAAIVFAGDNGFYPEDANTGVMPTGLGEYLAGAGGLPQPTIGGAWDFERDSYGVVAAVGVVGYTCTEGQLAMFDRKFDDGNVATGAYRKLAAGRYYRVLAE